MQPPSDASPIELPAGAQAADAAQNPTLEDALASLDLAGITFNVGSSDPAGGSSSTSKKARSRSRSRSKDPNSMWTRPARRRSKKKSAAGAEPEPEPALGSEEYAAGQPVLLSRVFKSATIELSADRLAAASSKGYRMVRATHGVAAGAWYFEVKVLRLGATGHTRLGWATNMSEIDAPVGFDAYGFGYRDIDGAKIHRSWRDMYAADGGYGEGDVLGFYVYLPDGERHEPQVIFNDKDKPVLVQGQDALAPVPGSRICYFKNGIWQGIAFENIFGGRYYPAASLYTMPKEPNCMVKFNFGPEFEFFPQCFGGLPIPRPMSEAKN